MIIRGKNTLVFVGVLVLVGIGVFFVFKLENTIVVENEPSYELTPEEAMTLLKPASESEPAKEVLPPPNPKLKILDTKVGYLNVRKGPSLSYERVDQLRPGGEYEYTETENGWYHIRISDDKDGWVYGEYVQELDAS